MIYYKIFCVKVIHSFSYQNIFIEKTFPWSKLFLTFFKKKNIRAEYCPHIYWIQSLSLHLQTCPLIYRIQDPNILNTVPRSSEYNLQIYRIQYYLFIISSAWYSPKIFYNIVPNFTEYSPTLSEYSPNIYKIQCSHLLTVEPTLSEYSRPK